MPNPGPRTIHRYSDAFKASAVRLSQQPGVRPLTDVVWVERLAVVFHHPQSPGQLVGQGAGGLIVATGALDLQRPGLQRIEGLPAPVFHPHRPQYRVCDLDQQRSHADISPRTDERPAREALALNDLFCQIDGDGTRMHGVDSSHDPVS
jgi:hypothetical protein